VHRELRNNGVVKFPGEASERVARSLLESGPATAAEVASRLGMSAAAVRRPLASLVSSGLVEATDEAPYGPRARRGRGRPSKVFSLTQGGRAACDQAYDDLALAALRFLAETQGREAVAEFAARRARSVVGSDGQSITAVVQRFDAAGFAAEASPLASGQDQLCQHHCPVIDAAREFPEFCDAEAEAIAHALGRHVTRLATLAHGDGVCTALIGPPVHSPTSRSRGKVSA
jgi:predicted ArsR family transcriptional regulator